jgi:hypothetical protein
MSRKLLSMTVALVALLALGMSASEALAEMPVKTKEKFTVTAYEENFIFGPGLLYCHGVHKTNSVKYPGVGTGSGSRGGEDIEVCKKGKGELIGGLNGTPGQTVNIDGNFWISDFDHQGSYEVNFAKSKVAMSGKSFKIVVVYPLAGVRITDLQEIAGSGSGFTTEGVTGEVGQTVDYSIPVRNNGWASETLSKFTDENCDSGTIAGGPGASPVAPGETTTYTCSHVLTAADLAAGSVTDNASVTATPPGGHGPIVSGTSNTVSATVVSGPEE